MDRRSVDAPFQAATEFRLFQKIVALDFAFPSPFPDLARDFTAEVVRHRLGGWLVRAKPPRPLRRGAC